MLAPFITWAVSVVVHVRCDASSGAPHPGQTERVLQQRSGLNANFEVDKKAYLAGTQKGSPYEENLIKQALDQPEEHADKSIPGDVHNALEKEPDNGFIKWGEAVHAKEAEQAAYENAVAARLPPHAKLPPPLPNPEERKGFPGFSTKLGEVKQKIDGKLFVEPSEEDIKGENAETGPRTSRRSPLYHYVPDSSNAGQIQASMKLWEKQHFLDSELTAFRLACQYTLLSLIKFSESTKDMLDETFEKTRTFDIARTNDLALMSDDIRHQSEHDGEEFYATHGFRQHIRHNRSDRERFEKAEQMSMDARRVMDEIRDKNNQEWKRRVEQKAARGHGIGFSRLNPSEDYKPRVEQLPLVHAVHDQPSDI